MKVEIDIKITVIDGPKAGDVITKKIVTDTRPQFTEYGIVEQVRFEWNWLHDMKFAKENRQAENYLYSNGMIAGQVVSIRQAINNKLMQIRQELINELDELKPLSDGIEFKHHCLGLLQAIEILDKHMDNHNG